MIRNDIKIDYLQIIRRTTKGSQTTCSSRHFEITAVQGIRQFNSAATPPLGPGPQPSPQPSDEVTPVAKSLLGNLKDGSLLCTLCSFACTRISSGFGKNVCSTSGKFKKKSFFSILGFNFLAENIPVDE